VEYFAAAQLLSSKISYRIKQDFAQNRCELAGKIKTRPIGRGHNSGGHMDASLGKIKAHLAGSAIGRMTELVALINENIKPPGPISEQDVYIRAMYIVSDEVNSFGGRFPAEELKRLTELLVDSPVMVGHRKDRLPVARTFHARLVERDGKEWIKSYFYWLRSAGGALDLKENIDGGIYKECSIGFTYLFPECCVCGKDIRTCRHEPLESYVVDGKSRSCYFNYRQVERVLETSLVYRGAVSDTAMSKDLANPSAQPETDNGDEGSTAGVPTVLTSPSELDLDQTYLVVPNYESMPVVLTRDGGCMRVIGIDGKPAPAEFVEKLCCDEAPLPENACGVLVGYRGKERCPVEQLEKHLEGRGSAVTRVELKLFPDGYNDTELSEKANRNRAVSVIRHDYCTPATLPTTAARLATRDGVRLWRVDLPFPEHAGFIYCPDGDVAKCAGYYRLTLTGNHGDALLEYCHGAVVARYWLRQFHPVRFARGCRFIADAVEDQTSPETRAGKNVITGELASIEKREDGLVLELRGALEGMVGLHPVRINGRHRRVIYRLAGNASVDAQGREDE